MIGLRPVPAFLIRGEGGSGPQHGFGVPTKPRTQQGWSCQADKSLCTRGPRCVRRLFCLRRPARRVPGPQKKKQARLLAKTRWVVSEVAMSREHAKADQQDAMKEQLASVTAQPQMPWLSAAGAESNRAGEAEPGLPRFFRTDETSSARVQEVLKQLEAMHRRSCPGNRLPGWKGGPEPVLKLHPDANWHC
jgi:hypothetical protein